MMNINGSIVAIVTPMQKKSKAIDYENFTRLIKWHIEQKTNAIVVGGSTGESATLTNKEWITLLELAKQTAGHKIPIIAGTGTCYTKTTIKKTLLAEKIGADAALIVTPYYNKPTQQGLKYHFTKIAKKCNLPIILYNVPSRTGCDLLPSTTAYLSKLDNIIGIKDATGKLERISELKQLCGENFILLSGDDASFYKFMLQGGDGVISVAANICPLAISQICSLLKSFDLNNRNLLIEKAKQINTYLENLYKMLTIESNPIPIKWLLAYLGKIDAVCRLPLTTLAKKHHKILASAYKEAINNIYNLGLITETV